MGLWPTASSSVIEAIRQNGSSSYWSKLERGEVLPSEFEAGFAKELEEVAGQECKTVGKWLPLWRLVTLDPNFGTNLLPKRITVTQNRYPKLLLNLVTKNRSPKLFPKLVTESCHPKAQPKALPKIVTQNCDSKRNQNLIPKSVSKKTVAENYNRRNHSKDLLILSNQNFQIRFKIQLILLIVWKDWIFQLLCWLTIGLLKMVRKFIKSLICRLIMDYRTGPDTNERQTK